MFVGFICSLPSVALAQVPAKGVSAKVQVDYYPVSGDTWAEVKASIHESRPSHRVTGERWEGFTEVVMRLSFPGAPQGQCPPALAQIDVDIRILIQNLAPGVKLRREDQARWAAYDRGLSDHEEGHMRIALEGAELLLAQVRASRGDTCSALQSLRAAAEVRSAEDQARYDTLTEHGLEQSRAYR